MNDPVPALYDWAGGAPAIERLMRLFYEKVPLDPILQPVFAGMSPDHSAHVAAFVGEVLGGPPAYSAAGGSHAGMIARHLGRRLNQTQRKRWVDLLLEAAEEVGLPDDPEFRSALVGYLEWGSRIAVLNSQDGVAAPDPELPMPAWGWGPPGGPYRA